jgi:hypothetical protein
MALKGSPPNPRPAPDPRPRQTRDKKYRSRIDILLENVYEALDDVARAIDEEDDDYCSPG